MVYNLVNIVNENGLTARIFDESDFIEKSHTYILSKSSTSLDDNLNTSSITSGYAEIELLSQQHSSTSLNHSLNTSSIINQSVENNSIEQLASTSSSDSLNTSSISNGSIEDESLEQLSSTSLDNSLNTSSITSDHAEIEILSEQRSSTYLDDNKIIGISLYFLLMLLLWIYINGTLFGTQPYFKLAYDSRPPS